MHHADDEEQAKVEQFHAGVTTLKLAQRENGVMKPDQQTKQNDPKPVDVVAPHWFFSCEFFI